jgi:outer membrane receptor for ferrienterochelin and colicin
VYTCSSLQEYLIKLYKTHKSDDGTYFKTNPNVSVITQKDLRKSQLKTVREVIELICKKSFPRKNIKGNLSAQSITDHTRFLIG